MKKSTHVPAVLVATLAASILAGGCSSVREVRRCVDDKGVVLSDAECEMQGGQNAHTQRSYGGYHSYPHWVYGGTGGNTPGSRAMGFKSSPSSGAHVVSSSGHTISRGGFGGGSHGFSGFGG
jgi:hypothetical protein